MTSNKFIIGLFGLLLLSSVASAYSVLGGAFYCDGCTDCTDALDNNTYDTTYLNATISGAASTCINDPSNIDGKTFDCNGYTISGTQTATTFGISLDGESNATIIGCEVSGFTDGYYITDGSDNVTVIDGIAHNNTYAGMYVLSSDNINIIDSTSYNNSIHGFRIRASAGCYLDNDEAYDNFYGFDIYENAYLNTINNSVAHDNTFYGLYIRQGSSNNSVWNTYAYNNSDSGFVVEDLDSVFNWIYSSNATNNTNYGFYTSDNNWTWIVDTRSNLNGVDGYRFYTSRWINVTNGTSYDNTGNGFSYNSGFGYLVAHSKAYSNDGYGLDAWGPTDINFLTFSEIYDNGLDGVYIEDGSDLHALRNDTIYGNTGWGFYAYSSHYHVAVNVTIHSNAGGGMLLADSNYGNYTNLVLYNNSFANSYAMELYGLNNSLDNVFIYNETNYIYNYPAATPNNFTNLTLGYNATIGLVNWGFLPITDVDLNSSNVALDPYFVSIDDSVNPEVNVSANITIASDRCAPLPDVYRKTGFPTSKAEIITGSIYPTSLTCVDNVATFNVSSFSGYTVASIDHCQIINSSGAYNLSGDVEGASIPFGSDWGLSNTCILIEASDVDFSCNGYSVTNNGTANSAGIAVNASFGTPYTNITIRDCPAISLYTEGVYIQNSDFNRVQNSTAYNNTEAGFLLFNAMADNITDSTAYSTGAVGTRGFYLLGMGYHLLLNNTAYSTETGFDFILCGISNLTDNRAYNNTIGFRLNFSSNNNDLWYNRAEDNDYGFQLLTGTGNNLITNTVIDNAAVGIDLQAVDDSNITDNDISTGAYGIAMGGTPINNDFYDNVVYDTTYGLYMRLNCNNNNFINNEFYDNTNGVDMQDSDGNNFTNNVIYDNTQYGLYIVSSDNNDFFHNDVYGHNGSGDAGFYIDNCGPNTFVLNDVHLNHYGFYLDTVTGSNFTNNGVYDNLIPIDGFTGYGFYLTNSQSNIIDDNLVHDNGRGITFDAPAGLPVLLQDNDVYNNERGIYLLNNADGFDFNNTNYSGNDVYDSTFAGIFVENSDNTVITQALLLHDNVYEVYGDGTIDNLTIEETNTAEEEYVTLANGASVTNLYLMYDYTDVHGRVNFHTVGVTAASANTPLNNTNFLLEPDFVSLNDTAQADYNVSATVTLNTSSCPVRVYREEGFPQSRDEIITNGSVYSATGLTCSFIGNTAQFDVASFSGYAVDLAPPPSEGGGGGGRPCEELSVELVSIGCPGDEVTYRVTERDSGVPVSGARVVAEMESIWYWSEVAFTNSSGEVTFTLALEDQYYFTASDGDYCDETVELKYFLCPEEFCYDDDDCEDTEYCDLGGVVYTPDMPPEVLDTLVVAGLCRPVECECGEVYDHACHPYECCADDDCDEGYVCRDHECVSPECDSDADCGGSEYCSNGACLPVVTGACGYVLNHTWFEYECCNDSDCPSGYICYENECILYRIETNETGFVGDDHGAQVYPKGQYELTITDPDGREFTVNTDENGYTTFRLESEGQYGIALLEENVPVVSVDVEALKRVVPPPEEKPVTLLDELLKYFWWLLILLLLIIGYILFRRRRKKKYRGK